MLYPKDEEFRATTDKPNHDEGIEMNAQQFNELKQKLSDLTASQLKSLQGEISVKLNKAQKSRGRARPAPLQESCGRTTASVAVQI